MTFSWYARASTGRADWRAARGAADETVLDIERRANMAVRVGKVVVKSKERSKQERRHCRVFIPTDKQPQCLGTRWVVVEVSLAEVTLSLCSYCLEWTLSLVHAAPKYL